ncbi:low molecular weight protein-tyrosine-phosphatase [Xinfangfangia pollutisoli]|uniref:low molecular weight protein-tyrosine-phosphatase n=1 Tax=Xinfangfangia pollutisoli TaxID=2865960 RepID=UPI001CD33BE5|nr:low molecular weight protein-tyrosine-phosphatase [Xinfangfangia pollutisoli]
MQSILFVCLGNICRSPTAEAVFRHLAAAEGLAVACDSAGTGGWHAGEPPHPPMIAAAARRGYDLAPLRARQLHRNDFARFGRILAMDRQNLRDIRRIDPGGGATSGLFLDHAPGCGFTEVPDPWYSGDFDQTLDLVEAACRGLIADLRAG